MNAQTHAKYPVIFISLKLRSEIIHEHHYLFKAEAVQKLNEIYGCLILSCEEF